MSNSAELRYCVYEKDNKVQTIAWYSEKTTHPLFIKAHHIPLNSVLASGYLIYNDDKKQFDIFEHYQLQKPELEKQTKIQALKYMYQHQNDFDDAIKSQLAEVYHRIPKTFFQKVVFYSKLIAMILNSKERAF